MVLLIESPSFQKPVPPLTDKGKTHIHTHSVIRISLAQALLSADGCCHAVCSAQLFDCYATLITRCKAKLDNLVYSTSLHLDSTSDTDIAISCQLFPLILRSSARYRSARIGQFYLSF